MRAAALLGGIVIVGASTVAAQERVNWTDTVNVAVRGGTLEKIRGCDGCGDAGATSLQVIESNGGYVEFIVPDDWTYLIAGLSHRTRGTRLEDIEFGIRFNGNGSADIVENGQYVGGDTEYQAGDAFRIEVANDRVRYMRDGEIIATSRRRPTYPLAFDVGLGTVGASVANAQIGTGRAADVAGSRANSRDVPFDDPVDPFDDRDVVGTSGDVVLVNAMNRWTDTGITVRAGDAITLEADGTIQMSGDRSDTAAPAGSRRSAPGALVRNAPAGTLIGRIGNGAPFAIGARRTMSRAPATGRLFLGVNDDYLEDNAGEFEVLVTVEPRH